MKIRKETPADVEAITDVTVAAFTGHPVSRLTEHFIVMALRKAGALAVSLVAETDGRVVGHIAFSPVEISDGAEGWYGLGPISVLPEFQKKGIGRALMEEGLSELKNKGARGFALVGDPAFYTRFGFRNYPELVFEGVPPEVFQCLPFTEGVPRGKVTFHEAFLAES